jgi:hypothetical protein
MFLVPRVSLLTAIVLVSLFVPISARAESEPNDSIASADLIGIGYSNAELNSTLTTNDDVDLYAFLTAANQAYVNGMQPMTSSQTILLKSQMRLAQVFAMLSRANSSIIRTSSLAMQTKITIGSLFRLDRHMLSRRSILQGRQGG